MILLNILFISLWSYSLGRVTYITPEQVAFKETVNFSELNLAFKTFEQALVNATQRVGAIEYINFLGVKPVASYTFARPINEKNVNEFANYQGEKINALMEPIKLRFEVAKKNAIHFGIIPKSKIKSNTEKIDTRQKRNIQNPFNWLVCPFTFILGMVCQYDVNKFKKNLEEKFELNNIDVFEIVTNLRKSQKEYIKSFQNMHTNMEKINHKMEFNLYIRELTSYMNIALLGIENVIDNFVEILNKGDQWLPSRNIFSKETLEEIRKYIQDEKALKGLDPIYDKEIIDLIYGLPTTKTNYDIKTSQLESIIMMPLIKFEEKYHQIEKTEKTLIYKSDKFEVQMSHKKRDDCIDTPSSPILCLQRPCKIKLYPKYHSKIQSCVMSDSEHVEIVLNNSTDYINFKIKIKCGEGHRNTQTINVDKPLVKFKIPSFCSVENEYFQIDQWKSHLQKKVQLESKNIDIYQFLLSDLEIFNKNTPDDATMEAIQEVIKIQNETQTLENNIKFNKNKIDIEINNNWYILAIIIILLMCSKCLLIFIFKLKNKYIHN